MKRSEINALQRDAMALFEAHRFALPPFARWSDSTWRENRETADYCRAHQMGWDITDFGGGDFRRRGLVIFCIRNGLQSDARGKPYAEKLLVVGEKQETPSHSHRVKMEDIIVRGGGNLILEMHNMSPDGGLANTPVEVRVDGTPKVLEPGAPLRLSPGESVTVTRNLWHRFYGEAGKGTVFVGEVSQVNDDLTDNYFFERVGRFPTIEEDEPPLYLLVNDYERYAQLT
jgi:D-lyxose ketol-isomerase